MENKIGLETFDKEVLENDEKKEKFAMHVIRFMLSKHDCVYNTPVDIILNDSVGIFSWIDPVKHIAREKDIWQIAEKISKTENKEEKYIIVACIMYIKNFTADKHSLYTVLDMLGMMVRDSSASNPLPYSTLAKMTEPLRNSCNSILFSYIEINFNSTSHSTFVNAYNAVYTYIIDHKIKLFNLKGEERSSKDVQEFNKLWDKVNKVEK